MYSIKTSRLHVHTDFYHNNYHYLWYGTRAKISFCVCLHVHVSCLYTCIYMHVAFMCMHYHVMLCAFIKLIDAYSFIKFIILYDYYLWYSFALMCTLLILTRW